MSDESKTPAAAPKPADKASPAPAPATESSTAPEAKAGGGGKSARESVGGTKEVHYGYFSNVRTPEYKSGWESIWGRGKPAGSRKARPKAVRIEMDIDDLPEEARRGLVEAARGKLKRSRLSYESRAAAGAVSWRIECEVRR